MTRAAAQLQQPAERDRADDAPSSSLRSLALHGLLPAVCRVDTVTNRPRHGTSPCLAPWACPQGGEVLRCSPPEGICLPVGLWGDDRHNGTVRTAALHEERLKIA